MKKINEKIIHVVRCKYTILLFALHLPHLVFASFLLFWVRFFFYYSILYPVLVYELCLSVFLVLVFLVVGIAVFTVTLRLRIDILNLLQSLVKQHHTPSPTVEKPYSSMLSFPTSNLLRILVIPFTLCVIKSSIHCY